jgi:hypothetical protein
MQQITRNDVVLTGEELGPKLWDLHCWMNSACCIPLLDWGFASLSVTRRSLYLPWIMPWHKYSMETKKLVAGVLCTKMLPNNYCCSFENFMMPFEKAHCKHSRAANRTNLRIRNLSCILIPSYMCKKSKLVLHWIYRGHNRWSAITSRPTWKAALKLWQELEDFISATMQRDKKLTRGEGARRWIFIQRLLKLACTDSSEHGLRERKSWWS